MRHVFAIRHAVFPDGPGPSGPQARLSYPYAIEDDGKLYVGKHHHTAAHGGGRVVREMAAGSGRLDLCLEYGAGRGTVVFASQNPARNSFPEGPGNVADRG